MLIRINIFAVFGIFLQQISEVFRLLDRHNYLMMRVIIDDNQFLKLLVADVDCSHCLLVILFIILH